MAIFMHHKCTGNYCTYTFRYWVYDNKIDATKLSCDAIKDVDERIKRGRTVMILRFLVCMSLLAAYYIWGPK